MINITLSTFLGAVNADEVILVANPIDYESIRALGRALALLDD
jgi:hypothetical protein